MTFLFSHFINSIGQKPEFCSFFNLRIRRCNAYYAHTIFFCQDIEKELGLSREKLIRMALLLGSDYTEGVR